MHDDQEGHLHANLGGIAIEKVGLDAIEKVVLDICRYLCQTFADPFGQTWELAAQHAENEFGSIEGGQVFLRVAQYIRVIRRERNTPFGFIDARCAKCAKQILPTELHIIMSTRYARKNDMQSFAAECSGLIGGRRESAECQNACMRLAQAMENIQPIAHVDIDAAPLQSRMLH